MSIRRLGLNLANSAWVGSATINIAGFLSVPLGGLLADTLAKRTPIGRFYTLAIGLGLAGAAAAAACSARRPPAQIGLVLVATSVAKGLFDGCIYAAMQDVVPPHARATAVGMMTMIGFFGAGITPLMVARIGDTFGMQAGIVAMAGPLFRRRRDPAGDARRRRGARCWPTPSRHEGADPRTAPRDARLRGHARCRRSARTRSASGRSFRESARAPS